MSTENLNTAPAAGAPEPAAERPASVDRPVGDRPMGDRPAGDRPMGDRPPGDRPPGDRPYSDRPPRRDDRRGDGKRKFFKKKVCFFCANKVKEIDYKMLDLMRRFVTDRGKILPRRITGTCAKHQRVVSHEIKKARVVALLPFEDK